MPDEGGKDQGFDFKKAVEEGWKESVDPITPAVPDEGGKDQGFDFKKAVEGEWNESVDPVTSVEDQILELEKVTSVPDEKGLEKKKEEQLSAIKEEKRAVVLSAASKLSESTTKVKERKELTPEEKEKRRKKIIGIAFVLAGLGACVTTQLLIPLFQGAHLGDITKDRSDQSSLGLGEPNHEQYSSFAAEGWAKYVSEGPGASGNYNPMIVSDINTRLLTGYFPGWFCVPQRVTTCEDMLGIKLDIPKGDFEQESYFSQMREEWDEKWWPIMKDNPNLSQEVKDFYEPDNRDDLRQWYKDTFPVNSQGWLDNQKNIADEKFERFINTGKLVPRDVVGLKYSHLLGSFVAEAYMGIKVPMLKDGFLSAGETLPVKVQQAIQSMEKITASQDYTFGDIEPYQKIIDKYYAKVEKPLVKSGQLKSGSLGRV